MVHGHGPFWKVQNPQELTQQMKNQLNEGDFRSDLSMELKRLMRGCLEIEEGKRYSMAEIQFS